MIAFGGDKFACSTLLMDNINCNEMEVGRFKSGLAKCAHHKG